MQPNPTREAIRRVWRNVATATATDGPVPDADLNALAAQDRTDLAAVQRGQARLADVTQKSGERPALIALRASLNLLAALMVDLAGGLAIETRTDLEDGADTEPE